MIFEDRKRIYSEDYADILIAYNGDFSVFEEFEDATINIINFLYAVVHVPIEQFTNLFIMERGYYSIPRLYGLISEQSLEASGVTSMRGIPALNLRGQGTLIGIIDTGIDYANPIFQYADGTTRIVAIWDQTIISDDMPLNFSYGTEYTREQINEALRSDDPLSIVPSMDTDGHGTLVAGIAGGNEVPEMDFAGVAPDAEFVVVKLKPAKQYLRDFYLIKEDAVAFQTTDILFAIQYLLYKSDLLLSPMSICVSIGSNFSGHDEWGIPVNFFSLAATRNGIVVSCAAGNEGAGRRHYEGRNNPDKEYDTVELNVGEEESRSGFSMEIWGNTPSIYSIDILTPTGEYVPRIYTGRSISRVITFIFDETTIYIEYIMVEQTSGDQLILLRFDRPTEGIWRFNVYETGNLYMGFNIWLQKGGFISEGTYFLASNPYTTILSIGNGIIPITVTAYNTEDESLYLNASRGNTRTGVLKPDIAAPGVDVLGPTLQHDFAGFTGTSVAAAHTAGIAALILEWGIVRNNLPGISTTEVKKLLIRGARRDNNIVYPNRDWGYGILDIFNVFDSLRTQFIV